MIKRTLIFGAEAILEFKETGVVPSDKWLEDNGGYVDEMSFKSRAEHDAYMKALNDYDGWNEYECAEDDPVEETCPHCKEWQAFFADRESNVYCPDCGSLIIPGKSDDNKTSPVKLQFRISRQSDWKDMPDVPTIDEFNTDFPAEFMHNYYSSNYVAWESDIHKFINDEISLEEFNKLGHEIKAKWQAEDEMKRLRQIIINETVSDFFSDLMTGRIEFRQLQTTL